MYYHQDLDFIPLTECFSLVGSIRQIVEHPCAQLLAQACLPQFNLVSQGPQAYGDAHHFHLIGLRA